MSTADTPRSTHIALHLARPGFALSVDLQLPAQGTTVLFGPSGSGKTTLLRCVAGLERASGRVALGDDCWQDDASGRFVPTWRRPLGYVFQEASLFAHLSVRQNLAYGMARSRTPGGGALLEGAVELLGIGHLLDRDPAGLSGGERQRVAIARALATEPRLLLLDEPLASLDAARRQEILPWLQRLRAQWQVPMLYVTHSADELARLADHLVVLDAGQVRASGPAPQVLAEVRAPALAGEEAGVLLAGRVQARDAPWHLAQVGMEGGALWVRDGGWAVGQRLRLRVLARDVSVALAPPQGSSIQNMLSCRVDAIEPDAHPSQALVRLACGDDILLARVTQRAVHALGLVPGQAVVAQVKAVAIVE